MSKKKLSGTIISLSGDKTVKVEVARLWQHPLYQKRVTRTKNYACHNQDLKLKVGDEVMIEECRPISKTKRFRVVSKVEK